MGTIIGRPLYIYEITFFLVYFLYYIHPHLFYASMNSTLMFYPKLFTRRRKFKTFASSRYLSILENFFPNDELFRLIVNYSAFTPVFFFIKPAYDLLIFYIIFVILVFILYKIIVDLDL